MKERKGEHPFGDAGQLILLALFLVVWMMDSFIFHMSTFFSDYIPLTIRLGFAGALIVIAGLLMKSGHVVVSGSERPNHVVATGAFRYVRHPLYLASLLAYLGFPLLTYSLISLAVFAGILIFHNYIAGYEEKLLELKFGTAYIAYMKKTGKWIPKRIH